MNKYFFVTPAMVGISPNKVIMPFDVELSINVDGNDYLGVLSGIQNDWKFYSGDPVFCDMIPTFLTSENKLSERGEQVKQIIVDAAEKQGIILDSYK